MGRPTRTTVAAALGALVLVEAVAAIVLSVVVGWSWREALDAFVVTNTLMGVTFGVCGTIIAWQRPSNPIGWLFLADGIGHATTAATAPLTQALYDGGAPLPLVKLTGTVAAWSWPWSICLFLPMALLLFPDGHLPSPRWRPVAIAVVVTAPLFVIGLGTDPGSFAPGMPGHYLSLANHDALQPLWFVTELRGLIAILIAIISLCVRYRRAAEMQRRQLLWLLLATIIATIFMIPWGLLADAPVFVLFSIALIPVSVTVAIVRYQLLDIRLVVSRALTWALLTVGAVAAYAGLVALLDTFITSKVGRSAAVTVIVALLLAPLLPRLQRLVDRAMYGDRRDPARVASRVGEGLAGGLPGVVAAVREALRLPYVAIETSGSVVSAGVAGRTVVPVPLQYAGAEVGRLLVGLRPGEKDLDPADRGVLALLAVPLAVAVHATGLSAQLQASREHLVAAREEERRRIRRDLHDGLGPTLTGVAFSADAAANLIDSDPERTRELLTALRADTRTAITDVRRLVDDLRPPALDELGLVGALRERAAGLSLRADGTPVRVMLDAPGEFPALPAAVEVAAYRIATEALTNVVRHSKASSAVLSLHCGPALVVEVSDDGPPNGAWRPGVGLQAMRERTAELGGRFEAGPSAAGGRVRASFPLEIA
jgi:two-component system, NarL family, sensor kinase